MATLILRYGSEIWVMTIIDKSRIQVSYLDRCTCILDISILVIIQISLPYLRINVLYNLVFDYLLCLFCNILSIMSQIYRNFLTQVFNLLHYCWQKIFSPRNKILDLLQAAHLFWNCTCKFIEIIWRSTETDVNIYIYYQLNMGLFF